LVKYIRCTLPSFLFLLFLMALFSTPAWWENEKVWFSYRFPLTEAYLP
jgi:hypothetical protein